MGGVEVGVGVAGLAFIAVSYFPRIILSIGS